MTHSLKKIMFRNTIICLLVFVCCLCLLLFILELLQQLSVLDGSVSSSQHRSSLKDAKPTEREREGVLFGVKRDLLQLISSLMYHCPLMQDKV